MLGLRTCVGLAKVSDSLLCGRVTITCLAPLSIGDIAAANAEATTPEAAPDADPPAASGAPAMDYYQSLLEGVDSERMSVPLLMHCVLEQVEWNVLEERRQARRLQGEEGEGEDKEQQVRRALEGFDNACITTLWLALIAGHQYLSLLPALAAILLPPRPTPHTLPFPPHVCPCPCPCG